MKAVLLLVGILLVMAGTVVLTLQGITVSTKAQQVLSIGPIQAATEEAQRTIPLPSIAGGVVLATGVVVVLAGGYKSRRVKKAKQPEKADAA